MKRNKHTVFVIGAGWVGLPLARQVQLQGHETRATTRSESKLRAMTRSGIRGLLWDCEAFDSCRARIQSLSEAAGDAKFWVLTVPPLRGLSQKENEEWHNDVRQAAEECGVEKLVLLSSTSVYPDFGVVRETNASMNSVSPHSGKNMLALEKVFDGVSFSVVVLRFGGLIGPGRHPGDRAFAEGWKAPLRKMNITTLQDAIQACVFVLFRENCFGVFNAVSPDHPSYNDFGKVLVKSGWPDVMYQSELDSEEIDFSGREVSSEKLLQAGFSFETVSLREWAKNSGGRRIDLKIPFVDRSIQGTLHHSKGHRFNGVSNARDLVVFVHGYKGFKDWGPWAVAMDTLCDKNRSVFRFDFTLNGVSPWFPGEIIEEQDWSANTYSREVEELKAVCSYWQEKGFRVHVIGHSRGGGIAAIAAHELQRMNRSVATCVLWASVADFATRFPSGKALEKWQQSDRLEVRNKRTGQVLLHPFSFYESFRNEADRLDILSSLKNLNCPVFIAHAKDDKSVSPDDSLKLGHVTHTDVKWLELGGHTFGGVHPWLSSDAPDEMVPLLEWTKMFFRDAK